MKTLKRLAALLTGTAALTATTMGVASAATIPPHTPSTAVVEESTIAANPWFKLQNADPMTLSIGEFPLSVSAGVIYQVRWTKVSSTEVNGTGKFKWSQWPDYKNGPVVIALYGKGYRYTRISVTMTQSWYGNNEGSYASDPYYGLPPYGHGLHHTNKPTYLASNVPTTYFDRD